MALENLVGADKFITALVPGNPTGADDKREGDDHIRGLKNVLANTFPNLNAAVTATAAELSSVANKVNRAGDTMTGPLALNLEALDEPKGVSVVNITTGGYAVLGMAGPTPGVASWAQSFVAEVVPQGGGGLVLGAYTGSLKFQTGTRTDRMVITQGGNLVIGGTDDSQNYKCNVQFNGGATNGLRVANEAGAGAPFLVGLSTNAPVSAVDVGINISVLGTGSTLMIRTNGNIQNLNNSYGALSDARLKTNVTDASPKLADLLKVRIVNYSLIAAPGQKQLGVIAQELQAIFPAMVEAAPIEGGGGAAQSKEAPEEYLSVKYSVFVPMLIKAVQELTARVEALEALTVP